MVQRMDRLVRRRRHGWRPLGRLMLGHRSNEPGQQPLEHVRQVATQRVLKPLGPIGQIGQHRLQRRLTGRSQSPALASTVRRVAVTFQELFAAKLFDQPTDLGRRENQSGGQLLLAKTGGRGPPHRPTTPRIPTRSNAMAPTAAARRPERSGHRPKAFRTGRPTGRRARSRWAMTGMSRRAASYVGPNGPLRFHGRRTALKKHLRQRLGIEET